LIEKVEETVATSLGRSSIFDSLFSILIVKLSFFWVEQGVVCFFEAFEFVRVSALIGMLF
jgi:hypothetical protein